MDQQQIANLRQLAATIRLSAHILERYPSELFNQVAGRIGQVAYLRMSPPALPRLRLESRSLKRPDQAIWRILTGHASSVNACAFSPDGKLVVSASDDTTVRLWDVQTGNCVNVFYGHTDSVTSCDFIPGDGDGQYRYIVSASKDATLRQWDIYTSATVHVFTGHTQPINACAVTPDGQYLLSASGGDSVSQLYSGKDNSLRLWNLTTKACEHIFEFPEELQDRINTCAISPDGHFALSGDGDHRICLWDLTTRQCVHAYWSNAGNVLGCAFLGNQYALCASEKHVLQLWDLKEHASGRDRSPFRELSGHQKDVTGCTVFVRMLHDEKRDGSEVINFYALSASQDSALRLWDLVSGECLHTLTGHTQWVNGCAVNPDGTMAASVSLDTSVIIWDIDILLAGNSPLERISTSVQETWNSVRTFWKWDDGFKDCAFSPDDRYVLSATDWFTLELRDRETGAAVQTFDGRIHAGESPRWVRCCTFHPDGTAIVSGHENGNLIRWDIATGKPILCYTGHEGAVWDCVFHPDGTLLLSASSDHTLRLWDAASGEPRGVLTGHEAMVDTCAISADGRFALSGARDWSVRIWDLKNCSCLHVLRREQSGDYRGLLDISGCAFSPDGKYAISGGDDHVISLWNVATGEFIRAFYAHTDSVKCCVFHPLDGRYFASASSDRTVRLWDMESGSCLCTLRGHEKRVASCAFSSDGRLLLSKAGDESVRLWDVSGHLQQPSISGHRQAVTCCRFSPAGAYALTGSVDRTLRLWDIITQRVIRIFVGHEQGILDCAFSHDGRYALSASNDSTLRLWDVQTGTCQRVITDHRAYVWGCAFGPDDRYIISGSGDRVICIWDRSTSALVMKPFDNRAHDLTRYSFTPDGRYILCASVSRSLKLWDVANERDTLSYEGLVGPAMSKDEQRSLTVSPSKRSVRTAISPDGRCAATSYDAGTVVVWEVITGKEICRLANPSGLDVNDSSFGSDGQTILGFTSDYVVRLWNATTGAALALWPADTAILCCAFHSDGQHVVVGDASGAVHFLLLEGVPIKTEGSRSISALPPAEAKHPSLWQFWKQRKAPTSKEKETAPASFFRLFARRSTEPIDAIPLALRQKLLRWIKASLTFSGGRRYLENHLELLKDESEQFFTIMISKFEDNPEVAAKLRISLDLLGDIRTRGGTEAAVRDAYSDAFDAFAALDLPPWLDSLRKQFTQGIKSSEVAPLLHDAIARSRSDPAVAPEVVASLQLTLARDLHEDAVGVDAEVISLTSSALEVFNQARFPKQFAHAQDLLGSAYSSQGSGEQDGTDTE